MAHREPFAVFHRITDYSAPRIQETNRGSFASVQILPTHFLQYHLFSEIRFVKRHEVRVNVPSVRVVLVHPMKDRAGQPMVSIESIHG